MITDQQEQEQVKPRPYIKATDEELDQLQSSIMHSVIQGESSIAFWNNELTAIRNERKERKKPAQQLTREEVSGG